MQGMLSLFLTAETESGEVALSKEMTSAPPGTILHELKSQFSILVNNLWGVYSQGQLYERAAVLLRAICQFLPTETVPLVGEPAVVAPGKFQGNEWKNHFLKYPGSDAWANGPIEPWLDQSTSIARLPVVRQIGSAWSTGTMLVYMPPSTCSYTPQFVYGILLRYLVLIRGVSPTLVPSDYAESWHTYATWKPDAYMVCCDEKG
jgi:hypothetical protein